MIQLRCLTYALLDAVIKTNHLKTAHREGLRKNWSASVPLSPLAKGPSPPIVRMTLRLVNIAYLLAGINDFRADRWLKTGPRLTPNVDFSRPDLEIE